MNFFRRHTVLVLLTAFVFGLAYQSFSVAYFYFNRIEIANKFCENKDKPEMKCNGKCHLNKKLTRRNQPTESDAESQIEPISFWIFGVEIPECISISNFSNQVGCLFVQRHDSSLPFFGQLFVPPDSATI